SKTILTHKLQILWESMSIRRNRISRVRKKQFRNIYYLKLTEKRLLSYRKKEFKSWFSWALAICFGLRRCAVSLKTLRFSPKNLSIYPTPDISIRLDFQEISLHKVFSIEP